MKASKQARTGKKAQYFGIFILIGFLLLFIHASIVFWDKYTDSSKGFNSYVGQRAIDLFRTYEEQNKYQTILQTEAKTAAYLAVFSLGMKGGFYSMPPCGYYGGFPLWNRHGSLCLDKAPYKDYSLFIDDHLKKRAQRLYSQTIPEDSFSYFVSDKTIIGKSKKNIKASIGGFIVADYFVPPKEEEMLKKIIRDYGKIIAEAIAFKKKDVLPSAIIAMIAQESRGDPNAVSPTGCAGLLQFCYSTANSYRGTFIKLHPCDCKGISCKTNRQCFPGNDDRFNPELSIYASIDYFETLFSSYDSYTEPEKFSFAAYNAGPGIVDAAIRASKKTSPYGKISWNIVKKYITHRLIQKEYSSLIKKGYFTTIKERNDKVREILEYVEKVSAYEAKAKQLISDSDQDSLKDVQKIIEQNLLHSQNPSNPQSAQTLSQISAKIRAQTSSQTLVGSSVNSPNKQQEPPSIIGSYFFKPVFRINNVAKLKNYELLRDRVLSAVSSCDKEEACLLQKISQFTDFDILIKTGNSIIGKGTPNENKDDWFLNCENMVEQPMDDFLSFIDDCRLSKDTDCRCEILSEDLFWSNPPVYDIISEPSKNSIFSEGLVYSETTKVEKYLNQKDFWDSFLSYSPASPKAKFKTTSGNYYSEYLTLIKTFDQARNKDVFAFMNREDYTYFSGRKIPVKDIPLCGTSDINLRVCAKDLTLSLPSLEPSTSLMYFRNPIIRFSINSQQKPPAPVSSVSVTDSPYLEGALSLTFVPSQGNNVKKYRVYWSEKDISIMADDEIKRKSSGQNPVVFFKDIDSSAVLSFPSSPSSSLQKDSLYSLPDGRLTYVLDVGEDGKNFFTGVSSLSQSMAESPISFGNAAISIDDQPPPPCSSPSFNILGSPPNEEIEATCVISDNIDDAESLDIFYSFKLETGNIYLSSKKRIISQITPPGTQSTPNPTILTFTLPKITSVDTTGKKVLKAWVFIATYQPDNQYQKELWGESKEILLSPSQLKALAGNLAG